MKKILLRAYLVVGMLAVTHLSQSQVTHFGGTIVNDPSTGALAWSNPGNAGGLTADGSFADATSTLTVSIGSPQTAITNYLKVTNLGFGLLSTDNVTGIMVTINHRDQSLLTLGTSSITDNTVRL